MSQMSRLGVVGAGPMGSGIAQIGLQAQRRGKAGMVHFHLLMPLPPQ